MHKITASSETLAEQSPKIISQFLQDGRKKIDDQLGDGFAKKHSTFLGLYLVACAIDLAAATISQQVRAGLDNLKD